MSKKKEYDNIFAKLCEEHNKIVPLLRKLNLRTVKVRNTRILRLRDILEKSEDVGVSVDLLTEYLILNNIVLQLLPVEQTEQCYDLIKSGSKENVIMATAMLYNLVETKKKELLNERVI